jgi:hypothetical protein
MLNKPASPWWEFLSNAKALADESSIIVQNGAKTVQNEALAGAELQCQNQALGGAVIALDIHGNHARKHSTVQVLLTCLKSTAMMHHIFGGMVEISGSGWTQQAVFLST